MPGFSYCFAQNWQVQVAVPSMAKLSLLAPTFQPPSGNCPGCLWSSSIVLYRLWEREDFPICTIVAFITVLHFTLSVFDWSAINPTLFWSLSILYSLPSPWKVAEPHVVAEMDEPVAHPIILPQRLSSSQTHLCLNSSFSLVRALYDFGSMARGSMCKKAGNEWEGRSRLILSV